jgi:hypothetical protein
VTLPMFDESLLRSPQCEDSLTSALPSATNWQARGIEGDGLCWLRCIAAIADPPAVECNQRLSAVRLALLGEMEQWGEDRWITALPWFGVRDWLWSERDKKADESSYNVGQRLLRTAMETKAWSAHWIFYVASSLYDIDFFIISKRRDSLRVYHRRVLSTPIPRIKAVVWHSSAHYEPLVVPLNDAAAAFTAVAWFAVFGEPRIKEVGNVNPRI